MLKLRQGHGNIPLALTPTLSLHAHTKARGTKFALPSIFYLPVEESTLDNDEPGLPPPPLFHDHPQHVEDTVDLPVSVDVHANHRRRGVRQRLLAKGAQGRHLVGPEDVDERE
ncbi:hypothetical protein THAOC_10974 [Thalassiosira oceanica]|uniref:Uncharacterized protein n=1 Tax=Thalassiosira oceanica TaxID=159749 RepID=K0SR84_THAOC|nr:hypothetical protein THAOC_10974 [Thalassiosira oceanica]|eukprot:EJK67915.1 hypothetical protein THAOC_10974 [Thalassiosira oceanica]